MGWLPNRLPAAWPGFRSMCQPVGLCPWRGSKEVRPLIDPELGMPATGSPPELKRKGQPMAVMIGVDPHKGSHTAVAIGAAEELLGQVRVRACAAARRPRGPARTCGPEGGSRRLGPGCAHHGNAALRGELRRRRDEAGGEHPLGKP
jgi:hypothetical protein